MSALHFGLSMASERQTPQASGEVRDAEEMKSKSAVERE